METGIGFRREQTRLDKALSPRSSVRKVTILDTAVAGTNLGDRIIMEAVRAAAQPIEQRA